jgi:hypothetical protein
MGRFLSVGDIIIMAAHACACHRAMIHPERYEPAGLAMAISARGVCIDMSQRLARRLDGAAPPVAIDTALGSALKYRARVASVAAY